MSAADILPSLNVSRETIEKLRGLVALLEKWNPTINLVSKSTIGQAWERHVLDSAQVMRHMPANAGSWVDIGSGAGFPGLVCAALAQESNRSVIFTLVESDTRKVSFLREAARVLDVPVDLKAVRVEDLSIPPQDVVSSRALAPVTQLLDYAQGLAHQKTVLLFSKGRKIESELTVAMQRWHIVYELIPSEIDSDSVILKISEFRSRL